jgi:hypothetical protein
LGLEAAKRQKEKKVGIKQCEKQFNGKKIYIKKHVEMEGKLILKR